MTDLHNSTDLVPPTLRPLPPLLPPIPDAYVLLALPIITYWALSLFFHYFDTHDYLARYRLHTPAELLKRNHVTRYEVVRDVILQQVIQTIVGAITAVFEGVEMVGNEQAEILNLYYRISTVFRWFLRALSAVGVDGVGLEKKISRGAVVLGVDRYLWAGLEWLGIPVGGGIDWRMSAVELAYWYALPVVRLGIAIFILDTWQYFLHRAMHESKWLYRTFHSRHHRLYVPYAFGALYNHPVEGLLMDTIGAGLGYKLSRMGTREGMVFFCFSTMKTVDDHCGYSLPWDPLQRMFWNNAGYHDVHHQNWGIKTNFSQPFLICWDRWLGTQWTGGDVSSRYATNKERAAAPTASKDAVSLPPQKNNTSNSTASSGSVKANGVNGRRIKVQEQVGADVAREGLEGAVRGTGERRRNKG